jgi:5-methylcytosine-specific restriction protein A
MALRPCITCGVLINSGSYCPRHMPARSPSSQHTRTYAWRKLRAQILARDRWQCYVCGDFADQVDHIVSVAAGGSDHPSNLAACCSKHNKAKGG